MEKIRLSTRAVMAALVVGLCAGMCGCDYIFYKRYHSEEYRFSILIPNSWEVAKDIKAALMIKAPADGPDDKFQENINVMVTEMPAKIPLDTFLEYNREELTRVMPKAYDMRDYAQYNGFVPGRVLAFDNDVDGVALRMLSGVWIKDTRVYVVTCVGEVRNYKKYVREFNKIMGSLRME